MTWRCEFTQSDPEVGQAIRLPDSAGQAPAPPTARIPGRVDCKPRIVAAAWRRQFTETLSDLAEAAGVAGAFETDVRAQSVEMTLPLEVTFEQHGGDLEFFADLPVWRWRTVFDQTPSRLRIRWQESEI